jgi:hypothetical protein
MASFAPTFGQHPVDNHEVFPEVGKRFPDTRSDLMMSTIPLNCPSKPPTSSPNRRSSSITTERTVRATVVSRERATGSAAPM